MVASPLVEKEPLCQEDLVLGRASVGIPSASFETGLQLAKRFLLVQEAKEEFWDLCVPLLTQAEEVVQVQERCQSWECRPAQG